MKIVLSLLMLELFVAVATAGNESEPILSNDFCVPLNYSYEDLDLHALNVPSSAEATIESLAAYLVKPAKNDREKSRAIFRWITENIDYNVDVFFGGSSGSTKSEDVLKSRRSICYGYSDLFLSLAREAGLQAVKVTGYGKGYGYVPGSNFTGPFNHAWNAVKINGSWYLIDSTWGAGYVSGEGKYVRKFDDHYFMTPPCQFIFSHFPDDCCWQLLDQPLTKGEYENLVYLEADFFNLGLMLGERNGTIIADKQINLSIFAPQDVLMMAKLEHAGTGEALDGYAFCQRDGGSYDIDVRFPEEGSYILKAYAKRRDNPGKYDSVLEYGINASSGGGVGFPTTFKAFSETGAYLFGPLVGNLEAGSSYSFRIRVPGARNVSVVCGDDWTALASRGDLFEGNATAEKGGVVIFGKLQGEEWDGLVKFESTK
ncbi:MAG: Transglutaminase-like superfamily protein [Methanosaeta sp. PtaU1.Bin112]|nr:MAG: Transglutaminase-like superfamily protein [Methanosaeta sp. PtaU1.Bin112]